MLIFRQLFDPQSSTYSYLLGDARATCAIASAYADQQSGNDQRRIARFDHHRRQRCGEHVQHRRRHQPCDKGEPPRDIARRRPKETADDTADACDPAIHEYEYRHGCADDHAADRGGPWCEGGPVDAHRSRSIISLNGLGAEHRARRRKPGRNTNDKSARETRPAVERAQPDLCEFGTLRPQSSKR